MSADLVMTEGAFLVTIKKTINLGYRGHHPDKNQRQVRTTVSDSARFSSSLLFPTINSQGPASARIFASPRAAFVCG
jgi:hypothetical protein